MKKKVVLITVLVLVFLLQSVGFAEGLRVVKGLDNFSIKDLQDPEKHIWAKIYLHEAFNEKKLGKNKITIDGKEYDDVLVVTKVGEDLDLHDIGGEYIVDKDAASFEDYVEERLSEYSSYVQQFYPRAEIISINGRPWQETKYKDFIVKKMKWLAYPGDPINNPEYYKAIMDERFNGFGMNLFIEKKSKEEVLKQSERVRKGLPVDYDAVDGNEQEKTDGFKIKNGAVLVIGKTNIEIYKEGNKKKDVVMNVTPKILNGSTMIPLRGVFDEFGALLEYDGVNRRVKVTGNDRVIVFEIDSDTAAVNGKKVKLNNPVFIENGRTFIPLRFVGENLGYNVRWIGEEQKIIIETK